MIEKILDNGKYKTYADKERFVMCKYNRRSNYYNYTLKIKCLKIKEGFDKLKDVKDFLKEKNINELLQPYYRTKKWLQKGQSNTISNGELNDKTIYMMQDPGYAIYQFIKHNISDITPKDLEKIKKEIIFFDCKQELLKHLNDGIYQLKSNNNHSKQRIKSLNTETELNYEIFEKLTRQEIENIGNDLIKFLETNNLEELKKKIPLINDEATEKDLIPFKERINEDFNSFKNSRSEWKLKGVNFLSMVDAFLPHIGNKIIDDLNDKKNEKKIETQKESIKSRNKKIEKLNRIIEELK